MNYSNMAVEVASVAKGRFALGALERPQFLVNRSDMRSQSALLEKFDGALVASVALLRPMGPSHVLVKIVPHLEP